MSAGVIEAIIFIVIIIVLIGVWLWN